MEMFLAVTATSLTGVFLLPQIRSLVRTGDSAGVSSPWAAMALVGNVAWIFYLQRLGLIEALVAPLLAALSFAIALRCLTAVEGTRRWLGIALVEVCVLLAVTVQGGLEWLGIALALISAVQVVPAVLDAALHAMPSGVSLASWRLVAAEGAAWGLYGIAVGDAALLAYGCVSALAAGVVLVRVPRRMAMAVGLTDAGLV